MKIQTFTCTDKDRDKNNIIKAYALKNVKTNQQVIVSPTQLKDAMRAGTVKVTNLRLTSDNRLISVEETEKPKSLDMGKVSSIFERWILRTYRNQPLASNLHITNLGFNTIQSTPIVGNMLLRLSILKDGRVVIHLRTINDLEDSIDGWLVVNLTTVKDKYQAINDGLIRLTSTNPEILSLNKDRTWWNQRATELKLILKSKSGAEYSYLLSQPKRKLLWIYSTDEMFKVHHDKNLDESMLKSRFFDNYAKLIDSFIEELNKITCSKLSKKKTDLEFEDTDEDGIHRILYRYNDPLNLRDCGDYSLDLDEYSLDIQLDIDEQNSGLTLEIIFYAGDSRYHTLLNWNINNIDQHLNIDKDNLESLYSPDTIKELGNQFRMYIDSLTLMDTHFDYVRDQLTKHKSLNNFNKEMNHLLRKHLEEKYNPWAGYRFDFSEYEINPLDDYENLFQMEMALSWDKHPVIHMEINMEPEYSKKEVYHLDFSLGISGETQEVCSYDAEPSKLTLVLLRLNRFNDSGYTLKIPTILNEIAPISDKTLEVIEKALNSDIVERHMNLWLTEMTDWWDRDIANEPEETKN